MFMTLEPEMSCCYCFSCFFWRRPKPPPTPTHLVVLQRRQRRRLLGGSEKENFSFGIYRRLSLSLLLLLYIYSVLLPAPLNFACFYFFPLTCHLLNITFNFCSSHGAVKCACFGRSFHSFVRCVFIQCLSFLFLWTPFSLALTIFNAARRAPKVLLRWNLCTVAF